MQNWIMTAIVVAVGSLGVLTPPCHAQQTEEVRSDAVLDALQSETGHRLFKDQKSSDRAAFFELTWEAEVDRFINNATFDLLGNVVVAGPNDTAQMYQISDDTAVGDVPLLIEYQIPGINPRSTAHVATDLDNSVFVVSTPNDARLNYVTKFAPESSFPLWTTVIKGADEKTQINQIKTLPSGDLILLGTRTNDDSPDSVFMTRLDPFFGGIAWDIDFPGTLPINNRDNRQARHAFAIDGFGHIFVSIRDDQDGLVVHKIDSSEGIALWPSPLDVFPGEPDVANIADTLVDAQGNILVVTSKFFEETGVRVTKFSNDGDFLWRYAQTTSPFGGNDVQQQDVALDADGNCYVLFGLVSPGRYNGVFRVNADGGHADNSPEWLYYPGGDQQQSFLITDGLLTVSSRNQVYFYSRKLDGIWRAWTGRLDAASGALVWDHLRSLSGASNFQPRALLVDAGRNVLTAGNETVAGSSIPRSYIRRFSQLDGSNVPRTVRSPVSFQLHDEGVWVPGTNRIVEDTVFYEQGLDPLDNSFGFGDDTLGASVNWRIGAEWQLGARAEVNGGSLDISLPVDAQWVVPPATALTAGSLVTLQNSYSINEAARLTTCVQPDANAGLTGGIDADLFLGLDINYVFGSSSPTVLDEDIDRDLDYLPGLNVRDLLNLAAAPDDDGWRTVADPFDFFSLSIRSPDLSQQATFINGGFRPQGTFQDILIGEANATNILLTAAGFPAGDNPLSDEVDVGFGPVSASAEYAALQLIYSITASIGQQVFASNFSPRVRYEIYDFSDGGIGALLDEVDTTLGSPVSFSMPESLSAVVVPNVYGTIRIQNRTLTGFQPGVRFETLFVKLALALDLFLYETSTGTARCFGCFNLFPFILPPFEIYNNSWTVDFPEQELNPFIVAGSVSPDAPRLDGSNRSRLEMIIYDQTAPSRGSFNIEVNRVSKGLLFGRNFAPQGQTQNTRAYITHQGREEQLSLTVVNDSTALIEIPNRFRLLPGIARIRLETALGVTDTIDLAVEYPRPLLDTVNPNIWAADPRLEALPVQVIDRKTPIGNDTFITRRDYFRLMRDELWNPLTAGGVPAAEYFPNFDFDQLPVLPTVLFDGNPLMPFVQPIDNGILNSLLAPQNFDRPKVVDVELCVPGPGGGRSGTRQLHVSAPIPVANVLVPSELEPIVDPVSPDESVEILVRGPRHVPFFAGYEEPKSGNYNEDSVVVFDGVALETKFAGTDALYARVPAELLAQPRRVSVFVHTPSNGTEYLERLVNGSGDVVFFDFVESGGDSAPILMEIRYRQPEVETLSPSSRQAINCSCHGQDCLDIPLTVLLSGEHFRDDAVVYVDNEPRETEFIGSSFVRVHMELGDFQVPGIKTFRVVNPPSTGNSINLSDEIYFEVLAPASSQCLNLIDHATLIDGGP